MHSVFCSRHRKSLISYHLQKQSNLNTCFPFGFLSRNICLFAPQMAKSHLMIFGTKSKGRRSSRILKIGYKEIGTKVCFFFCDFFFLLIRSNQVSRRTENRDCSITRVLSSRKMKLIFSSDKDQLAGPYFFTEDWMDLAFSQNKITRMHC